MSNLDKKILSVESRYKGLTLGKHLQGIIQDHVETLRKIAVEESVDHPSNDEGERQFLKELKEVFGPQAAEGPGGAPAHETLSGRVQGQGLQEAKALGEGCRDDSYDP